MDGERPVGRAADVELDAVSPLRGCGVEGGERVLALRARGSPVTDHLCHENSLFRRGKKSLPKV